MHCIVLCVNSSHKDYISYMHCIVLCVSSRVYLDQRHMRIVCCWHISHLSKNAIKGNYDNWIHINLKNWSSNCSKANTSAGAAASTVSRTDPVHYCISVPPHNCTTSANLSCIARTHCSKIYIAPWTAPWHCGIIALLHHGITAKQHYCTRALLQHCTHAPSTLIAEKRAGNHSTIVPQAAPPLVMRGRPCTGATQKRTVHHCTVMRPRPCTGAFQKRAVHHCTVMWGRPCTGTTQKRAVQGGTKGTRLN